MKLAHIVPFKNRELLLSHDLHLWVASAPGDWASFYRSVASTSDIIIDNGAFEGEMVSLPEMLKLATSIGADTVVLPDVFRSGDDTLAQVRGAISSLSPADEKLLGDRVKAMGVLHGPTPAECEASLVRMCEEFSDYISILGFSYMPIAETYVDSFPGGWKSWVRPRALAQLNSEYKCMQRFDVHCLGLHDPAELFALAQLGWIKSCDSSLAAKCTYSGIRLEPKHLMPEMWDWYDFTRGGSPVIELSRPDNFFEYEGLDVELLSHNIQFLDHIAELS